MPVASERPARDDGGEETAMTRETEYRPDPEPDLVREARRRAELPADQWEKVTSVAELTQDAREALREQTSTTRGGRIGRPIAPRA